MDPTGQFRTLQSRRESCLLALARVGIAERPQPRRRPVGCANSVSPANSCNGRCGPHLRPPPTGLSGLVHDGRRAAAYVHLVLDTLRARAASAASATTGLVGRSADSGNLVYALQDPGLVAVAARRRRLRALCRHRRRSDRWRRQRALHGDRHRRNSRRARVHALFSGSRAREYQTSRASASSFTTRSTPSSHDADLVQGQGVAGVTPSAAHSWRNRNEIQFVSPPRWRSPTASDRQAHRRARPLGSASPRSERGVQRADRGHARTLATPGGGRRSLPSADEAATVADADHRAAAGHRPGRPSRSIGATATPRQGLRQTADTQLRSPSKWATCHPVIESVHPTGSGSRRSLNREHASDELRCSNWPRCQNPGRKARSPPTRAERTRRAGWANRVQLPGPASRCTKSTCAASGMTCARLGAIAIAEPQRSARSATPRCSRGLRDD
jgi:hypothetical protein